MAAPRLETGRLVLRGHRPADFDDCARMWGDPDVVRFISGTPLSREAAWSRLLRYAGHWALMGFGYWVVETKADGRFIGEVGLADYRREIDPPLDGRPEAGWVLRTEAHGQGYAREAVACMLGWADRSLEAAETVCILDPAHAASRAVADAAGYTEQATATYMGGPTLVMSRPRGG